MTICGREKPVAVKRLMKTGKDFSYIIGDYQTQEDMRTRVEQLWTQYPHYVAK